MRRYLTGIAILLGVVLVCQGAGGTRVSLLLPEGAPAILTQMTSSTRDLFSEGILLNRSEKNIVGYRIGWLILLPDKATRVELGEWEGVRQREGLTPKVKLEVPAQLADFRRIVREERALSVRFFVAGVKFADGPVWEADLKKVAEEAAPQE